MFKYKAGLQANESCSKNKLTAINSVNKSDLLNRFFK